MSGSSVIVTAQAEQAIREFERLRVEATGSLRQISELGGKLSGVFASLGAGLSIAAFGSWIKGAIDAGDAASKLSARTGVAVKDIAGLQLAYDLGGAGGEAFATSMGKLSKEMVDGGKNLGALGIKTKDVSGTFRSTKDVMYDAADAFAGMQDGAQKTAFALEIFGKSGGELIPLLNGGSAGLREMDEMAQKLGLTMSAETAANAEKFNDTLDLLKMGSQGVARGIAAELLPTLSSLAGSFLDTMTTGDKLKKTADFLAAGLKLLYSVGLGIVEVFSTVGKTIGAAGAQIVAIMSGDFKMASKIGREWQADIGASWADTAKSISAAWDTSGNATVDSMLKIQKTSKSLHASAAEIEKQTAAAKKESEAQAKLMAELSGVTGSYMEDLTRLQVLRVKQNLTDEQYVALMTDLIGKQPGAKKVMDDYAKSIEAANKVKEAANKLDSATYESLTKGTTAVEDQVKAMARQVETYGLVESAVASLDLAKAKARLAAGPASYAELVALDAQIAAFEKLGKLASTKESLDATKAANAESVKDYDSTVKKYGDLFSNGFADMLNNGKAGWKSFTKSLTTTFKTSVADQIYKMFAQPFVMKLVASLVGVTGAGLAGVAQAAAGGGPGAASSIGSNLGLAGTIGSIGAGAMQTAGAILSGQIGLGSTLSAGLGAIGTGTASGITAGLSSVVGALGPIALGIAAAVAIWKKLDTSGTYHTGGASSASSAGVSTIRAESLGFEVTRTNADTEKMTAGLVTGIVSILDSTALAFGKTAGYTAATAFADDTSKDGAWGALLIGKLGEKIIDWQDTKTGSWAPKVFADGAAGQTQYLAALSTSVRTALDGIGLPAWAQTMLDGLGAAPAIEDIAKVVDSINATQRALVIMGDRMAGFANLSDDATSALIKASGGIDVLANNASAYYDIFYDEGEKAAATTKQVADALAAVGLAMPTTHNAFRAQVEAQLALGDAGAPAVAALLGVASAFAQVTPELKATAAAGRTAADILSERIDQQKQLDQLTMSSAELLAQKRAALDESNRPLFDQVQVAQSAKVAADALASVNRDYQQQIDALVKASLPLAQQRALEVAGMDASTLALHAQLGALQAAAEATAVKTAADKAAADALASTNNGYQQQIDALVKASLPLAQQRALEVAGMDASTLALYERLEALRGDTAASVAHAALMESNQARADAAYAKSVSDRQAQDSAAAALAASLLNQRAGMEITLYNLTHTAAEQAAAQRQRELAGMDATLRPLQSQIFAMQDQASAAAQAATALENAAASARAIGGERVGLQREMFQLQGDTNALRQMEIAALDPSNRALKESIFALQDKMAADQAAAQAQAAAAAMAQQIAQAQAQAQAQAAEEQRRAAEEQVRAAEQLKSAWGSVTDSIFDEVARIRGLISGGGVESLSAAQTKFAIATAQARAGDMDVTKMLPQLSQTMLQLAETNAVTAFDLRLIRAQTASSLQMTAGLLGKQFGLAVPSYDVGTDSVPQTGLALIHEGEKITPAAYNNPYTPPGESGASSAQLVAEIRSLRQENREIARRLDAALYAIAKNTGETAGVLEAAVNGEVPVLVKVAP
ncbi:MAG: hypothetical protein WA191_20755 [Telluria sp.]